MPEIEMPPPRGEEEPRDQAVRATHVPGSSRLGPIAGLVGVVLYLAGSLAAGSAPKPDATTRTVIAHFVDKRDAVLGGTLLVSLGALFLLFFLGYLRSLLALAEGSPAPLATVTVAAWVLLFAIVGVGSIPLTAVVWLGAGGVSRELVRLVFDISNLSLYALSATAAAMSVLAPSLLIWHTRVLPRWLIWLGLAEVAVNAVELGGIFSRSGPNAGGFAAGIGPLMWVAWVAALSLFWLLGNPRVEGHPS